jgi:hypothetical protein
MESARGVAVPLVVRPDYLAAARDGSHDAFGSDARAYDGSISGVYDAGLQLAERTGGQSKSIIISEEEQKPPAPPAQKPDQQKDGAKPADKSHNNR